MSLENSEPEQADQSMNDSPQIEAILSDLTEICCGMLESEENAGDERVTALVQSLSTNGWERHSADSAPLSTVLKNRVKEKCQEPAMHRGAMIDGIVDKIQRAYDDASRMRSSAPKGKEQKEAQPMPPKTAT